MKRITLVLLLLLSASAVAMQTRGTLTFSFSFPDQAAADAVLDDFVRENGWTETIPNPDPEVGGDIPNPVTQQQHASGLIETYIMNHVKQRRVEAAIRDLREQAAQQVDAIDVRREER